jgi:cytoskeletal protein CcmA (bactofilin family)
VADNRDVTGMKELQALLGAGTEFEGKLTFEGRVRIDGKLKGEIFGSEVLILGPAAEVRANIEVGTLIVRGGALWGDVRAERLVELYAPARIYGDIVTAQIYVDKGVTFEGRCTMLEKAPDKSRDAAGETSGEST